MKRYIKKSVRAALKEEVAYKFRKIYCVFSPFWYSGPDGVSKGKVELVVYDKREVLWDRRRRVIRSVYNTNGI